MVPSRAHWHSPQAVTVWFLLIYLTPQRLGIVIGPAGITTDLVTLQSQVTCLR